MAEKTQGRTRRDEVVGIPRELLQRGGQSAPGIALNRLENGRYAVVNAACYAELDRFSAGIVTRLEKEGVPVAKAHETRSILLGKNYPQSLL